MFRVFKLLSWVVIFFFASAVVVADEQSSLKASAERPPLTRAEMKWSLEALKARLPRLPLSPVAIGENGSTRGSIVYNARARAMYLPAAWYAADFISDPNMSVDPVLKVKIFWVVSRANDCHY